MKKFLSIITIISIGLLGVAACNKNDSSLSSSKPLISVSTSTSVSGNILIDSSGRPLYNFIFDVTGQASCNSGCAVVWPHIYFSSLSQSDLGSNLKIADFGTTTNADGSFQTTYKGHPLYKYTGDSTVNGKWTVNGNNIEGGVWFAVQSDFSVFLYSLQKVTDQDTTYLTTSNGITLYNTASPNSQFTPYKPSSVTIKVPARFSASDFSMNNGVLSYKGRILYTYGGDAKLGDINGANISGTSLVLIAAEL